MAKIQIIGAPQSPFVWATRMAAVEKGLDYELVVVGPHAPEVYAVQPFGKLPGMRHGDVTLAESRAIAHYFDGLNDANPLFPRDSVAAARAEQWIMHLYMEYTPAFLGGYIAQYFFPSGPDGKPNRAAIEANMPRLQKSLGILEKQLAGRDYIAGDFSFADLLYPPQLHYLNSLPEGSGLVAASPNVSSYLARMSERPAFKATFPPPMPSRAAA